MTASSRSYEKGKKEKENIPKALGARSNTLRGV
jgi:hypothetical protein